MGARDARPPSSSLEVPIRLEEPKAEQVDRLLELNEDALPAVNSVPASEMSWFLDQGVAGRGFCRVALAEDELAGLFIGLLPGTGYRSLNYRWFESHWQDFAYIDRVIVDPRFQRRGIAQSFYQQFEEWASSRASRLTCDVNRRPSNPVSMAFHAALGFAEVGRQETEDGAKEVFLLARPLLR